MNLFTTCSNCGKRLAYDAASAGDLWLCPACGTMLRLPPPLPPTAPAEILEPDLQPIQSNPLAPWLILLFVLVLFEGLWLFWQAMPHRQTWEQQHRQEIYDIKAEAEGLAARNLPEQAYARFRDLAELASGNPINDVALKAALRTAAQEQDQMVDRILQHSLAAARAAPFGPRYAAPPQPLLAATIPSSQPRATTEPPKPKRPDVHALPPPAVIVDDQRIGQAITAGTQYLLDQFRDNRVAASGGYNGEGVGEGVDALAVYALLQAYQATGDSRLDPRRPFMRMALDELKRMPMNSHYATYSRSLRANALALGERREDLSALDLDLRWLLQAGPNGAYTYGARLGDGNYGLRWDNSNSQYGLLGVWAAAGAGLAVPPSYWRACEDHWTASQLPDGQWGYVQDDLTPRKSMTLAGIASLLVTQEYLGEQLSRVEQLTPAVDYAAPSRIRIAPKTPQALAKGLAWLETGDNSVVSFSDGMTPGYSVYGLERVGLASGFKYFGAHDWYRQSAADVVSKAQSDGGWGDAIQTSFALLFLARGRHPVVMNKLRYEGDWNDRPRDVADLTAYIGHTLERQLNWQVVPLNHDWTDWTDCPILFISGRHPPQLSDDDQEKLRRYILSGGLLLTESEDASPDMTRWATDLGQHLFPRYPWQPLPAEHPLWTMNQRVKDRPPLMALSNGARLLMIHLPQDVSRYWQATAREIQPATSPSDITDDRALGEDIFLYAIGRGDLRNRLVTSAIEPVDTPPAAAITLAQLSVAPDSDPEPAAWPRMARWFRRQTDLAIDIVSGPLDELTPGGAPIAHLTGVAGFKPTDAQCAALRHYVDAGGVVLIDPCGGPNDFLHSVRADLLPKAFPTIDMTRLGSTARLLTNSGNGMSQLWPLDVRDYVREQPEPVERGLWILRSGKGAVIVSTLDITSGLLGSNTWGIAGFTPGYSLALAKNFVLWAWDGAKE